METLGAVSGRYNAFPKRIKAALDERLEHLEQIYRQFDAFLEPYPLACEKGCTACCTRNVIMTSLEGRWILEHLDAPDRRTLLGRIAAAVGLPRFHPTLTFNRMADLIESGEDVPEEAGDPDWGVCPLLEKGECTIYALRPFMCRSMVSEVTCHDLGHATVKPIVLTAAHVLMQVIEHLDVKGFSGNLSDVFLEIAGAEKGDPLAGDLASAPPSGILSNRPLRRLMVPSEHRKRVQALLASLSGPGAKGASPVPGSSV